MWSRLLGLSQLKNTIMAQHMMPPNVTPEHEDAWMAEGFNGEGVPLDEF